MNEISAKPFVVSKQPSDTAPMVVDSDHLSSDGFRLVELQIQNFGTYDGAPSVIRFGRGNAIFTGRNGVGKTTAIDAFRMLIAQEPNFNDATTPEARKRDRDIRTYYQGVVGKRQVEGTSRSQVLRPYDQRKFMVIVGVFVDARGQPISAARLVQYDTQGQGNSQRYVIATDRLDIARDFPHFATARAIRTGLADKGARTYDTFDAYRAALSGHFGIDDARQTWALFERAIGTKTVDNLTEFMRDLILPASALAETADQLVRSTAALDEAYQTVKSDEAKIKLLDRIVKEIGELERSFDATAKARSLQSYRRTAEAVVMRRAVGRDLAQQHATLRAVAQKHANASARAAAIQRRVADLELQQRQHGGQLIAEWRRDIEDRERSISTIRSDLDSLAKSLIAFEIVDDFSFEESHHDLGQWESIKARLLAKAEGLPGRTAAMDRTLAGRSADIAKYESERTERQTDLEAAERAKSNLPRRLIETRERLADELGKPSASLPFFGELVRVSNDAVRDGWEGALNRLLGNMARRLLVPGELYAKAARAINDRHLGLRLEYDRVERVAVHRSRHGADRAAGKLDVRQDNAFAGHVRAVLDQRFDHQCFDAAGDGFQTSGRALTKAGQSRDGARHVKDDRREIDDRSAYLLGWDTAERIALLKRDLRRLETDLEVAAQEKSKVRAVRDGLLVQADQMRTLADRMGAFDSVDVAKLQAEIDERAQWIEEATENNPDFVALTAAIASAHAEQRRVQTEKDELGGEQAVLKDKISKVELNLERLGNEVRGKAVPYSAWTGYVGLARELQPGTNIFVASPDTGGVLRDDIWEAVRSRLERLLETESNRRERLIGTLNRLTGEYLREFPAEGGRLAATGISDEESGHIRADWRQRRRDIEARELVRHRERLQQAMTDAIDNGIVAIKTRLDQERTSVRDTIAGINETLRAVVYDPAHGTRIRFVATDSSSKRIVTFGRDLRQVTDDWIGAADDDIEERYLKTKRFIDQVRDVPENGTWRREVLDTRRWFTFVAQEYKLNGDGSEQIVNDYDGASGTSGGQKERLAMTVMAAGLAWRLGIVDQARSSRSFRVLMLDEAFKNSHDETTRALLGLFEAFGFQMVFAMPSKNLAVVAGHINRAFAVDTKRRRTIIVVHALRDLVQRNRSEAAAAVLQTARAAGIDVSNLDLAQFDQDGIGLADKTVDELVRHGVSGSRDDDPVGHGLGEDHPQQEPPAK